MGITRAVKSFQLAFTLAVGTIAAIAIGAPTPPPTSGAAVPTQATSFGANPQEQKEDFPDDGHWTWQKQELGPAKPILTPPEVVDYWDQLFPWILDGQATLTPSGSQADGTATAMVINSGSLPWGFAAPWSVSGTAIASYQVQWTSVWVDPDDPDGLDQVANQSGSVTVSGGGYMSVSTTAAADSGSSCSASAAISGTGSVSVGSHTNLSVSIGSKSISCDAQYDSAASSLGVGGNIGAQKTDDSGNVTGHFSLEEQWAANGKGSCSGSANYSIDPGESSTISGTSPATVVEEGTANASGSGSGASPGSESMQSTSSATVADPPTGD